MALFHFRSPVQKRSALPSDPSALEFLETEDLIEGSDGVILLCEVPDAMIDAGQRAMALPEGAVELTDNSFDTYNRESETVRNLLGIFRSNHRAIEIEKQIVQKRIPARSFPRELKTIREKRDYMLRQEEEARLQKLCLPDSLTVLHRHSFPILLKAIEVSPGHPAFCTVDGVLFSKDGKTLLRYPGLQDQRSYTIPAEVEQIAPGAFEDAVLDTLTIPGTLHTLTEDSFAGLQAKSVVVGEGIKVLASGCFTGSRITALELPASLDRIEQEAFRRLCGLTRLEARCAELELGPCLFRDSDLEDVTWWCWSYIPKGAFLNSRLRRITVPAGVEAIGPYAFAGCYTAKSVTLPESVSSVSPFSFDLGPTYNRPVQIPAHLFSAVCRFPARSPINKHGREAMFRQFEENGMQERPDILKAQISALETMPAFQKKIHASLRRELEFYRRQLANCPVQG